MMSKITSDFHFHTDFSGDCQTPMVEMVRRGIDKGFTTLCVTEHLDMDFPEYTGLDFSLDLKAYYQKLLTLQESYHSQIDLRFGIELGLQPHLSSRHEALLKNYPFDFVLGSSHIARGMDPYYPDFYEGRSEEEAYLAYFQSILENIKAFSQMDVYGHLDYVVRYGPNKNKYYSYEKYRDILDEILTLLIHKGIGIECNTGGLKYGLGHPNPCEEILLRYHQLGGELLTIGSDAHAPEHLGYAFSDIPALLKNCGFRYYTIYKDRTPSFLPL